MRIAVIADDLTGALDTGVQFSNWGFNVQVTDEPISSTVEVVVVNTDSRRLDPESAYELVFKTAKKVNGFDIIYKKTDSTMRGNVGAEIQAVLDATGEETAVLTPCYPPTSRWVIEGHLYVDGVPLSKTEYSHEHGSKQSYIPDILRAQTTHPITQLGDSNDIKNHSGILVIDSKTENDLLKIAGNLGLKVICGSAGLAAAIAENLVKPPPVLSVIGSMRTVTQHQSRVLEERLGADFISLDMKKALTGEPQDEVVLSAVNSLNNGRDVIITSAPDPETVQMTVQSAESLRIPPNELETRITGAFGDITGKIIDQTELSGIIISGGATAMAVCAALSVNDIAITEELRPGIPLLKLDEVNAVTKAGGFGEPDALVQALQYIKRKHK